ncbi:MAG TPA: matrixin family metalloprotease [Nocardioides sp.]|nr:matrixin family metalloprotease [Nocardioides sp.]
MKRYAMFLAALLVGTVFGTVLEAAPGQASNLGLQVNALPSSARAGAAVYLTGTAPSGRVAVMQVLRGGSWLTISGQSGAGAAFKFRVPTGYYGIRTLRAMSPPAGLLSGEIDGDAQTVRVLPGYTPQGYRSQSITADNGYRWNPCAVIHYRVNLAGMSSTNLKLIRNALRKVHLATGLQFSYAGGSRVLPFGGAWNRSVPTSGLYFAFATATTVPAIKGLAGLGGEGALVTTSSGSKVVASGGVTLAKGWWKKLYSGFKNGPSKGSLLLHEIGHAVGLMHVGNKPEIMYPVLGPWSYGHYGWGDLAGLQQLGADQGCLR